MVICSAISLFVWLNPAPTPEPPGYLRWIKVTNKGESLPAWSGPWKCIYDNETQLMWEVKSYAEDIFDHQCSFSWYSKGRGANKKGDCFIEGEAADTHDLITAANNQKLCGRNNWRLPTEAELQTLLYKHAKPGEPKIARDFFPYAKNGPYWTADEGQVHTDNYRQASRGAIAIDFTNGGSEAMPYKTAAFTRLVSDGIFGR